MGNELDRLHNTVDDLVLDTRVLSLRILSNDDRVDIVVRRLESDDGPTRTNIGEERECSSQSEIERDVSLSNWERRVRSDRPGRGVFRVKDILGVARGPLSATVFFLIDTMAFSGIEEAPLMMIGVTSTSWKSMGTCERAIRSTGYSKRTTSFCSTHLSRNKDGLDSLTDLGSDPYMERKQATINIQSRRKKHKKRPDSGRR